jgi:hypothetical protein
VNSVAAEEKTVPVPLVAFVKHVQAVANKSLLSKALHYIDTG